MTTLCVSIICLYLFVSYRVYVLVCVVTTLVIVKDDQSLPTRPVTAYHPTPLSPFIIIVHEEIDCITNFIQHY